MPSTTGLSTFPGNVQRASVTCGWLAIRLAFQVDAGVMKYNLPSTDFMPTGVPTPWPLRRKLVSKIVWELPDRVRNICILVSALFLLMSSFLLSNKGYLVRGPIKSAGEGGPQHRR